MRTGIAFLIIFSIFAGMSCEKNPASNEFKNQLTLGTGMSGFTLIGQGTTFNRGNSGSLQLYWRLESATDMAGSDVTIKIDNISSGTPVFYVSQPYANKQSYGHIMLSSITISDAGSYRATGILVTGSKQVATVDFTVQ